LKEDLQHLISLQGIDASLASASIQKQEVPGKIARLDQNFDFLRERVDEEKRRLDELLKEHRAKEDSLKRGIEHLKKTKRTPPGSEDEQGISGDAQGNRQHRQKE